MAAEPVKLKGLRSLIVWALNVWIIRLQWRLCIRLQIFSPLRLQHFIWVRHGMSRLEDFQLNMSLSKRNFLGKTHSCNFSTNIECKMMETSLYTFLYKKTKFLSGKVSREIRWRKNEWARKDYKKSPTFCMSNCTVRKVIQILRYNMKCSGKHDTTRNITRNLTFSPQHFMLYRGKSISFWDSMDFVETL